MEQWKKYNSMVAEGQGFEMLEEILNRELKQRNSAMMDENAPSNAKASGTRL